MVDKERARERDDGKTRQVNVENRKKKNNTTKKIQARRLNKLLDYEVGIVAWVNL